MSKSPDIQSDSIGSVWNRWDLHIHTPGTALNDQFGPDAWDSYLTELETATPKVVAIGVTDYCSIKQYQTVVEYKTKGRLQNVRLILPNIEFRVAPSTTKGKGINLHVLVSPADPNHVKEVESALSRLVFTATGGKKFSCNEQGLTDLGSNHKPGLEGAAAYKEGVNQFKPSFETLCDWWKTEHWLTKNSLIAVSAKTGDGTSGLSEDGFAALRNEIQNFSHIVFSAAPSDRDYWLGIDPKHKEEVLRLYGGMKPCIIGCDAHELKKVLKPDEERYCWIKAEATFEGLKQVVFEPAERVHLGSVPPGRPEPNAITKMVISGTDRFAPAKLSFNEGLVAIIGERGSGKTALADLLARGAHAATYGDASFLSKAFSHLNGCQIDLHWSNGDIESTFLDNQFDSENSRVLYLSQQFVERMCSTSQGLSDELMEEIERVVFRHLDPTDRGSAYHFSELREQRCGPIQDERSILSSRILEQCEDIEKIYKSKQELPSLDKRLKELKAEKGRIDTELKSLASKGEAKTLKLADENKEHIKKVDDFITLLKEQQSAIGRIRLRIRTLSQHISSEVIKLDSDLIQSGLAQWESVQETRKVFTPILNPSAQTTLDDTEAKIVATLKAIEDGDYNINGVVYNRKKLLLERDALNKILLVDAARHKRAQDLQRSSATKRTEIERLEKEIERISKSSVTEVTESRRNVYKSIFDGFAQEQAILEDLYRPLGEKLTASDSAAQRLNFYVKRCVDVRIWAQKGEALLDLRKPPFQGEGALLKAIREKLEYALVNGTGEAVVEALDAFMEDARRGGIMGQLGVGVTPRDFAQWLFSTEHIKLEFGIKYDGTSIEQLSPGTRGIVLLILYLGIDTEDDRPMIIDQPEDNLDPRSVFQVLVQYFRASKQRRQVIVVTHNANLVVNTDAEQVIVASSKRDDVETLPRISYLSGALENTEIQKHVCDLLEGGTEAFRERERRYFGNIAHRAAR